MTGIGHEKQGKISRDFKKLWYTKSVFISVKCLSESRYSYCFDEAVFGDLIRSMGILSTTNN